MPRVPLLSGSSIVVANLPEETVVLRPPRAREVLVDPAAAVTEALRFPLAGPPLADIVRGGRVTVVVEPPSLPLPGGANDPRQLGIEAVSDELERLGVPTRAQTMLVAGGLARRAGPADMALLVRPEFRRRFRGRVLVHDVESEDLADLGNAGRTPLRVNRAIVETDAVVVVTAAESVVNGGPAALLAAAGPEPLRAAGCWSLLETAASQGWQTSVALERALAAHVPLFGVSLVLNHPQLVGTLLRDYPYGDEAVDRIVRSPARRLLAPLPGALRRRLIRSLRREVTAAAAYGGPPAVAHAEALIRAVAARSATLDRPLDALVVGIPPTTPHLPREEPNPVLAAYLGLGLALRLWRDAFPVTEGGTAILLHPLRRRFERPTQQPYRTFFGATRFGREPIELRELEREAASDERALAAYRAGHTCHPLLPFADWEGCQPALSRLGAVLVAGCRDAVAARQLGLVPTHGLGAALEMARGRGAQRVGVLLSPPFFPIRVGY